MKVSRRALLTGAGVGLAVVTGAGALAMQPGAPRTPAGPLKVLDADTFSTLAAVVERICPGGPSLPDGIALQVAEKVDALLDRFEPAAADEVVLLLRAIESPLVGVIDGNLRPFSASSPEERDRVLERWRTSELTPRRTVYRALHGLVSAAYWATPAAYQATGYGGPPVFVVPG